MAIIYENRLTDLQGLFVRDPAAEIVDWQGRRALRLNGLAVIPDLSNSEGSIEVQIGSDGAAYPGIVFHLSDVNNYELAYAQPHTSGVWDAIQYDPVFHGSNTWQLYYGANAQHTAEVPLGNWFRFKIDFQDRWAAIHVGDQPPLVVSCLAHSHTTGLLGIWTYLPAYFCDLRVSEKPSFFPTPMTQVIPTISTGETITEWFLEGFGKVACEANGILNINRYLPVVVGEVRLTRQIEGLADTPIEIDCGFSDELTLQLDDQTIFAGQNLFKGNGPNWADRGYVAPDTHIVHPLTPGLHRLTAVLKVTEYFGWGLVLALRGGAFRLLPASLG
jgi:hypothetical protein